MTAANNLTPSSTRYPSATLYPHKGVEFNRLPREDFYPSDAVQPSDRQWAYPDGILTGELLGDAANLSSRFTILPSGIVSDEAFGLSVMQTAAFIVQAPGIDSAEAFGAQVVSYLNTLSALGVPSSEAFGQSSFARLIAALGIDSSEQLGVTRIGLVVSAPGVSSAELFGQPDGLPRKNRWPSPGSFPSPSLDGLHLNQGPPMPVTIAAAGISSAAAAGTPRLSELVYVTPPPSGAVGQPRKNLRPGKGKYPGPLVAGTDHDSPVTYKRIRFPSTTIFPSRGMYPDRWDMSPRQRYGWFLVTDRSTLSARRNGRFRKFVASFTLGGHFNAHGVFSSDLSGKMGVMVELSDGVFVVELSDGLESAELLALDLEVELA